MTDLLPCPFCPNGRAEHDGLRSYIPFGVPQGIIYSKAVVYCTDCGAEMVHPCEDTSALFDHEYRAVQVELFAMWNTRTPPPGYALVKLEGAEERVAHIVEAGIDLQSGHQAIAREIIRAMTEGE